MKQKIRIILSLFLGTLIISSILLITSEGFIKHPNHFSRNILKLSPVITNVKDLKVNSYYIIGTKGPTVYFGNETDPLLVLFADTSLSEIKSTRIRNRSPYLIKSGSISMDFKYFYLNDQLSRTVFKGNLANWEANVYVKNNQLKDALIPISDGSLLIRTLKKHKLEYALAKDFIRPDSIIIADSVLQRQADGMFSCDGILNYDASSSRVTYVYFYRNEIICCDTSLRLLYRSHTIDTTRTAKIQVSLVKTDKILTLSKPPLIVNRKACSYKGNLYINSGLKADNESSDSFDDSSVIDVYGIKTGAYRFSFYVPKYNRKEIKDLRIADNKLIAISDHYLLTYTFSPQLLRELVK